MSGKTLARILTTPMRCTKCGKVCTLLECEPCIAPDGSEGTGFGCPEPDCGGYMLEAPRPSNIQAVRDAAAGEY